MTTAVWEAALGLQVLLFFFLIKAGEINRICAEMTTFLPPHPRPHRGVLPEDTLLTVPRKQIPAASSIRHLHRCGATSQTSGSALDVLGARWLSPQEHKELPNNMEGRLWPEGSRATRLPV